MSTFFICACEPVGVFNNAQKNVIEKLDQNGYCFSSGGPLICGKWVGNAVWFLEGAVVSQIEGYKGIFEIVGDSTDVIHKVAGMIGLVVSKVYQSGPRASWASGSLKEIA